MLDAKHSPAERQLRLKDSAGGGNQKPLWGKLSYS